MDSPISNNWKHPYGRRRRTGVKKLAEANALFKIAMFLLSFITYQMYKLN